MGKWEEKKLQDVCEKITDGTHQTPTYFDDGYIFLSSKNVTSQKIDWENVKYVDEKQYIEFQKRIAPKVGDILLAKNGTTGVAAMVDRDVPFNIYVSLAWLRSKGEVIPEYLLYFINSPNAKKQFNNRLKGVGVPNLHLKEIREVKMSFPKSHSEQQRIVAKLDGLFAKIDQAISLLEANLQHTQALMGSVLDEEFGKLGEKYKKVTLPDVVDDNRYSIKRGPFGSALKKSFFVEKGYKVYEQKNAIKDDFSLGHYYVNDEKFEELKAFEVKPGDIIISCSGTIGKIAIAPKNIEKGIINQALLKISLDPKKITNKYFAFFFQNYVNQGELKSKGAAIKNIVSVKELKKIPFPLPKVGEQEIIVSRLNKQQETIEDFIKTQTQKLDHLKALKSSLLDQAFKGAL